MYVFITSIFLIDTFSAASRINILAVSSKTAGTANTQIISFDSKDPKPILLISSNKRSLRYFIAQANTFTAGSSRSKVFCKKVKKITEQDNIQCILTFLHAYINILIITP